MSIDLIRELQEHAAKIKKPIILSGSELSDIFASLMLAHSKIAEFAPEDAQRCYDLAISLMHRFNGTVSETDVTIQ